eukprot:TRINITY_DN2890_c0_g1_i2.p1 TRINITY_DN2890_c0_g1~~TRINITY_DN2890_c0_g1_i2.p1  ORF type:complete len:226 (+),score=56.38 TRINITY_DN2890_c0_g1_i2:148-825(+)
MGTLGPSAAQLQYRLVELTGEAPGQRSAFEELGVESSAETSGWQSEHFCTWPQTLTFELEHRSVLSHMQLLSHEFMIASKIEVYAVDEHDYHAAAAESKLGHFSLADNEARNFDKRELKTIQLNGALCTKLKLVVRGCHINTKNLYSQAGIVSLRLFGAQHESLAASPFSIEQGAATLMCHSPCTNQLGDLAVDSSLDQTTQEQIRQLQIRKDEALAGCNIFQFH